MPTHSNETQFESIPEIRPFSATYLRRVIFIMRFIAIPILVLSAPVTALETFVALKDLDGINVGIISLLLVAFVLTLLSLAILIASFAMMAWTLTLEEQHQRLL